MKGTLISGLAVALSPKCRPDRSSLRSFGRNVKVRIKGPVFGATFADNRNSDIEQDYNHKVMYDLVILGRQPQLRLLYLKQGLPLGGTLMSSTTSIKRSCTTV
jgi:hypothetical protein